MLLEASWQDFWKLPVCLSPWVVWVCEARPLAGYWANWADSLSMIKQKHPTVAERILVALHHTEGPESTRSAAIVACQLTGVESFEIPSWEALSDRFQRPRVW